MLQPSSDDIKKFEKKVYLLLLAALLVGIAMLAAVWKMGGVVGGIIGVAAIIIIVLAVTMAGFFFNFFYRIKAQLRAEEQLTTYKESEITWPAWFTKWGRGVLIFMLSSLLYVFGSRHENDFGGNRFVYHSIIAGIVAGLIVYNIIRLQKPKWSDNPALGMEIGFYIVAGCVFLCLVAGPVVNSRFATARPDCQTYQLTHAGSSYIHIEHGGRRERFKPPAAFTKKVADSKTVVLCVRKGYLGYDYVTDFRTGRDSLK